MKYTLLSPANEKYSAFEQVLINRGITYKDIDKYINSNDNDINPYNAFDETLLKEGATKLLSTISKNGKVFIIVDCDVDGFTSSAIMINYLYDIAPSWVESCVEWGFHEGKQHGLPEFIDTLEDCEYDLIICPDSSSNDLPEIERLHNVGTEVLILDHHECDNFSPYATTINSQYNYPNPYLSGAGVVWQFCRYLDSLSNKKFANEYLDLVAYGLQSDMEDIRAIETKTLIFKGLQEENIKNPYIAYMLDKHNFSLNKADYKPSSNNNLFVTPIGVSFFLTPFGNAICRSGTMEEKELIFNAMLKFKAFVKVPSTKRGHKPGEMETIVMQAIRVSTNVKNRQEREVTAGLELIEKKIKEKNLLDQKVLLVLINPGEIAPGIAGLVANKMMARYQRPCCILTKVEENGEIFFRGSARGYTKTGLMDFKALCEAAAATEWARGHANAFGLSLYGDKVEEYINYTNEAMKDISTEPVYYVDYIWDTHTTKEEMYSKILTLADMNDYIGTGFDRPYICIKNLMINKDNFKVMKSNTLKYTFNNIDIVQFAGTDEEIEMFNTDKYIFIDAICKCCKNEWCGNISPQLQMIEYNINETKKWMF